MLAFFFSSSVKTIGTNSNAFFLESLSIGVGEANNDVNIWQGQSKTHKPTSAPSNDSSLFGNDSEYSDFEELDKNSHCTSVTKETGTFCMLNGEDLLCEVKGCSNVFCLRFSEKTGLKVILSITGNSEESSKRIRIQENDILLVITTKISEKELKELIKKIIHYKNPKEIPIRIFPKEITEHLEKVEKDLNTIVIAGRIMREI